jgi:hypothetical protein
MFEIRMLSGVLTGRGFRITSKILRLLIIEQLLKPYCYIEHIGEPKAENYFGNVRKREDLAGIALGATKVNE